MKSYSSFQNTFILEMSWVANFIGIIKISVTLSSATFICILLYNKKCQFQMKKCECLQKTGVSRGSQMYKLGKV